MSNETKHKFILPVKKLVKNKGDFLCRYIAFGYK